MVLCKDFIEKYVQWVFLQSHRCQSVFLPSQSAFTAVGISFSFGSRGGSHMLSSGNHFELVLKNVARRRQARPLLCNPQWSSIGWGNASRHPLSTRWCTHIIQVNSLFLKVPRGSAWPFNLMGLSETQQRNERGICQIIAVGRSKDRKPIFRIGPNLFKLIVEFYCTL